MRRTLVAGLACLPCATAPAQTAQAHAILVDSRPESGATIAPGRVGFVLRYNSRIDARRSRLTLTAPDGSQNVLPIGPAPTPDVLTTEVPLAPGAYSLRWQVLATDGHITRGDVPFTVAPLSVAPLSVAPLSVAR